MKLKTSLFSKGLIISDLKRFWWVSALYTLALFFSVPFNHYIQSFNILDNREWLTRTIIKDLTFIDGPSQAFLVFVPIVIVALVFRFMQKSRSASLYHSLPFTRATLYFTGVISALILFIAPLVVTTIVMLLLNWLSYLSVIYSVKLIFTWLLYSLLFGLLFLSMGIFVAMFTGNSIAQLAFVYILNFLPRFLVEFVRMNLRELLFGFDTYSNVNFYKKMPMEMLFRIASGDLTQALVTVYIIATVALFMGGLYAFKLRRPETAGDIITFRPIRPIFIYGATTCATLLGGSYFLDIAGQASVFGIFGYFVSSVISYAVVQMITNKSFKIQHTYKGYLGFALVLVIFALGIKFDIAGYENKVPDPGDVEEVYMGYNLYWWQNKDKPDFKSENYGNEIVGVYTEPKNIENVTRLHKLILDNRKGVGNYEYIAYKLKSGKQIVRKYPIDTELYAFALGPIYESLEYKENRFPILGQEPNDIKYIEISDTRAMKNPNIISDKLQLKEFKAAIIKDIKNLSYQDLAYDSQRALLINITDVKDRVITYMLRSSYKNTIQWLQKEGIYSEILLKPESVHSVRLENYSYYTEGYVDTEIDGNPKKVEITDRKVIQELIDLSLDNNYSYKSQNFSVYFMSEIGSRFYNFSLSFDAEVSPELQNYIEEIK